MIASTDSTGGQKASEDTPRWALSDYEDFLPSEVQESIWADHFLLFVEKLSVSFDGFKAVDIPCITVIPVSGSGLQKSYTKIYRGTEQSLALQNRTMIICVVSDKNLEKCVDSILEHGSDGQVGDGKIFIYDVQDAIRLSTKVRGDKAII